VTGKDYWDDDYIMKKLADDMCFDYEENERLQAEAERLEKEPAEEVKEDGDLPRHI
jgi:hypothetical protein